MCKIVKLQVQHDNECQKFFEKVFEVSKRRVLWIAKNIRNYKELKETRGGKRPNCKRNLEKREMLKVFMGNFKPRESHYSLQKSRRLYLSSVLNLNISKMWKMFTTAATIKNTKTVIYISIISFRVTLIWVLALLPQMCAVFAKELKAELNLLPAKKTNKVKFGI